MPALLRVTGLGKDYLLAGGRVNPVLKNIALTVQAGEFVALMGPSGSGKSTFMNILGCLDTPTTGEYVLHGRTVAGLTHDELAGLRNHLIGFVFQGFNLLPRCTAVDNVALPLLYAGVSRGERRRRALELITTLGLGDYGDALPNQLSGGQQQRLAIARALINAPALVLADEPTGNLDSHTSQEIMALFSRLNREQGITLLVVTHEPDIARYARRLVKFRDGRIVHDGAVEL